MGLVLIAKLSFLAKNAYNRKFCVLSEGSHKCGLFDVCGGFARAGRAWRGLERVKKPSRGGRVEVEPYEFTTRLMVSCHDSSRLSS